MTRGEAGLNDDVDARGGDRINISLETALGDDNVTPPPPPPSVGVRNVGVALPLLLEGVVAVVGVDRIAPLLL